jgi:hypothetical protein
MPDVAETMPVIEPPVGRAGQSPVSAAAPCAPAA